MKRDCIIAAAVWTLVNRIVAAKVGEARFSLYAKKNAVANANKTRKTQPYLILLFSPSCYFCPQRTYIERTRNSRQRGLALQKTGCLHRRNRLSWTKSRRAQNKFKIVNECGHFDLFSPHLAISIVILFSFVQTVRTQVMLRNKRQEAMVTFGVARVAGADADALEAFANLRVLSATFLLRAQRSIGQRLRYEGVERGATQNVAGAT